LGAPGNDPSEDAARTDCAVKTNAAMNRKIDILIRKLNFCLPVFFALVQIDASNEILIRYDPATPVQIPWPADLSRARRPGCGCALLDLDYVEDKDAETDMNVVMTRKGQFIEVQASGEESTFSPGQFAALLALATRGIKKLSALQKAALG
jgi:hypothetical protein